MKKRNIIIICLAISILVFLILFFIFKDKKEENIVKEEENKLEEVLITSGSVKSSYNFIPKSFNPEFKGAYSDSKVTIQNIDNETILSNIFNQYTGKGKISFDQIEKTGKQIYGENLNITITQFDNYLKQMSCILEKEAFSCYDNVNLDTTYVLDQLVKAEKDKNYLYIYNKIMYADYIVDAYNNKVLVIGDNEVFYTEDEIEVKFGSYDIIKYPIKLFENHKDLTTSYKHTFRIKDNGSYYWHSSEIYKEDL